QDSHAEVAVQNNMSFGGLRAESGRIACEIAYDAGRDGRFEVNANCGQRIAPFVSAFAGARVHHKDEPDLDGVRAVAGVRTAFPLGIDFEAAIDHRGQALLELGGVPHLTNHLSLEWRANTERELRANVNYDITKHIAVTAGYDTTHGKGVGLRF